MRVCVNDIEDLVEVVQTDRGKDQIGIKVDGGQRIVTRWKVDGRRG